MDINICIDTLGLNANEYTLTQSNTPHELVEWRGNDPQPTQAELEGAWATYEAEQDATAYIRARTYPSIGDQLDMIFHAIEAGTLDTTSEFFTTLQAVKDAHPKA